MARSPGPGHPRRSAAALLFPAHPSAQAGASRHAVTASDAREARAWDVQITRMLRDGQLRSRGEEADLLIEGRSHERLDQYHQGVKVFGGELVRQADGGQTVSVFGLVYAGIRVDPEPVISSRDAAAIAAEITGAVAGRNSLRSSSSCRPTRAITFSPTGCASSPLKTSPCSSSMPEPARWRCGTATCRRRSHRAGRAQRHEEGEHDGSQRRLSGD